MATTACHHVFPPAKTTFALYRNRRVMVVSTRIIPGAHALSVGDGTVAMVRRATVNQMADGSDWPWWPDVEFEVSVSLLTWLDACDVCHREAPVDDGKYLTQCDGDPCDPSSDIHDHFICPTCVPDVEAELGEEIQ